MYQGTEREYIPEEEKKGKENDMEMEIKWVPGKNQMLTKCSLFSFIWGHQIEKINSFETLT